MISSELRIGNYVMYTENILTISSIDKKRVVLDDYNRPLDFLVRFLNQIKPIPLTEEWLIRFGFGGTREYYYDTEIGAIEFYFEDEILVCDIYDSRNKNIKYVHQLQNLYFALTGKELK